MGVITAIWTPAKATCRYSLSRSLLHFWAGAILPDYAGVSGTATPARMPFRISNQERGRVSNQFKHSPINQPVLWEELTWEHITNLRESGINMVILSIGATEQHGLHLPVGVDTFSAIAVAHGVSTRTGIPVLPALPYGCSLGHSKKWAGTISLRPETLSKLVLEIAEWVYSAGFNRLLLLNGHVTNWAPLRCGLENVRHIFSFSCATCFPWDQSFLAVL